MDDALLHYRLMLRSRGPQALRQNPNHVMTLCNYGALLHEYLQDIKAR
jgi:hypothetical protein